MSQRIGHLTTVTHQAEVYKSLLEEKERQIVALCAELASVREDAERWRYADSLAERARKGDGEDWVIPIPWGDTFADSIDAARKGESDA